MPLVDAIGSIADPMVLLDLDVDTGVRDKIGVEFYVRRETDNLPRWRALFDLLADLGLASREKAHTLLTWPGFTPESQDTGAWADNLALGDLLFRGKATSMFWRTINHIKLAYHPRAMAPRSRSTSASVTTGSRTIPSPASDERGNVPHAPDCRPVALTLGAPGSARG